MWPLTLDMTRDECRGILRRSELETYSSVISTFRAQGGLSDAKVRILRDLREVFHISQERHKAEARRVANDERLCTVAELIAGPNTGQEWSKEGRRNFPFLSRAVSHTALATIANNAQAVASAANSALPLPAQTIREKTHDHMQLVEQPHIVINDPLQALMQRTPLLKRPHLNSESNSDKFASVSGPRKKRLSESAPLNHTNMRIQQLYHTHSKTPNPIPAAALANLPSNRKNATPKRTPKATAKSQPRANKKQNAANKKQQAAAAAANQQPITSSTVPYGSSIKSQIINVPDSKSLLGETFPDNTFGWSPLQTIASVSADQLKFDQILQQHQPTFSSAITPTSPVQVVFTSHVNLPASELPKYESYSNNLITESTPIHWVNEDPPSESSKPLIQHSSEILQPIVLSNTSMVAHSQPNPMQTPVKMVIPAAIRKTNSSIQKSQTSATKTTKAVRRKVQPEAAQLVKIAPQSTAVAVPYSQPNQANLHHPSSVDPNSLQISSITNKLPSTNAVLSMNLLNASTKLPTQILQTSNIIQTKPLTTTTASPLTGNLSIKPKIQVTQQIIVPSPHKPFQSKGNVKLVQSANGSIMLKGTNDIVTPTTTVGMTTLPAGAVIANTTAKTTSFPKIQLVKGTSSNMILMQKVGNPFGTAIKDGRPMKFNVVQQPKLNATPVLLYDVATGKPASLPASIVKQSPLLNVNQSVQITEDTPVDILPAENIILAGNDTNVVQPAPIISATHIIIDNANHKPNTIITKPLKGVTITQKQLKPVRIQPMVNPEPPKRMRTNEEVVQSPPTTTTTTTSSLVSTTTIGTAIIEPTDWEEQLDQQKSKQQETLVVATSTTKSATAIPDEDDGIGGYMSAEDSNDDDIIQYEGDSTDYQDEFSLDGVPEPTTKPQNSDTNRSAPAPEKQSESSTTQIPTKLSTQFPLAHSNGSAAAVAAAVLPKPSTSAIGYDGSQDGDDEDTQDGESMMMQMEEFDENGCSQIRNVSLEELVDSGHIILDDS